MSKILELREKRAKAWDAAKAFLDSKRGADGLLPAEDVAVYEKMEALEEENIFRSMAKIIQTASGDRKIPVVASKGTAPPGWMKKAPYRKQTMPLGRFPSERTSWRP